MLRNVRWLLMLVAAGVLLSWAEPVLACPFCREALAAKDNRIPMAYMYSILFMLAMPPTVLLGIGFAIYRTFRKHAAAVAKAAAVPAPQLPVIAGELAPSS